MNFIESGIYVRIEETNGPRAPVPRPLLSGFNSHTAYRVLGIFNPSESGDAYMVLSNDADELWFICNRHLRTVARQPEGAFRLPLAGLSSGS